MKVLRLILASTLAGFCWSTMAAQLMVTDQPDAGSLILFDGAKVAPILVATNTDGPVLRAAADLAADFARVTGTAPDLERDISSDQGVLLIIGTIGQSSLIDQLASQGKLDATGLSGQWESYVLQVVTNPLPNVSRALVIAGSDRRGTIYGVYELSKLIGVSPWYWWADVPVPKKKVLAVNGDILKQGPPGVKYRGLFINDEDWGMNVWASKTFDPQFHNIGPKTYAKVFELMLRLRLNYLWPAMHACSTSFGSVPENAVLAGQFGIVIGSSHCEPMLYNNVSWKEKSRGRWNYALNRDVIHDVWEKTAQARGQYEAVWTLGIRGIHDASMERPPNDMPGKIQLMNEVFHDQRDLLSQYVSPQWGPVAQCFVPYKEVLPIYDAGLKVPDDVTLVWVDDNFGYLRRLSNPDERKRSGGAGVYWHLSYYGFPHSYTWINTTAPGLMWEELHKAWENDAGRLWVLNVGDLKPAEIGIDYYSKLAWSPDDSSVESQSAFLNDFATRNFGKPWSQALTELLTDFYRLGTVRKPELMERSWARSLTAQRAAELMHDYQDLLNRETSLSASLPESSRDAFVEMIGFPARVLGDAGLIFLADRQIQETNDVAANANTIAQLRSDLEAQVNNYNHNIAGGKWNHMMPGLVTGGNLTAWNSQVRWPWGEHKPSAAAKPAAPVLPASGQGWRDAATADRQAAAGSVHWTRVEGLGPSGRAMALEPATLSSTWDESNTNAPTLEYDFTSSGGDAEALVNFVPTFRIYPGLKLRVAVVVDDHEPVLVEVPGSSGAENENGTVRSSGVQNNYAQARIPMTGLSAGKHILKIRAVDPGAVIDAISIP